MTLRAGHFQHIFRNRIKSELEKKEKRRLRWEDRAVRHLFKAAIQGQQLATRDYRRMFKEEVARLMDRELVIKEAMIKYLKDQQSIMEERLSQRTRAEKLNAKALSQHRRGLVREKKQRQLRQMEKLLDAYRQQEERYKFEMGNLDPQKILSRY
eukprot:jgi/Bigna1/78552/fgenesh1_pg.55_\